MGMEIEHNNKWVCMKRTDDNYFTINGLGEIKFPKIFRLTSISGEQLVSTVPGIRNNENILTDIQYSGFNPGGFAGWIRMSSNFTMTISIFRPIRNYIFPELSGTNCSNRPISGLREKWRIQLGKSKWFSL